MSVPGQAGAVTSLGALDALLAEHRDRVERTARALLDLEDHAGRRVLDDVELTGCSRVRWAQLRERLALLWTHFDLLRRTVETAGAVRARRARPGPAEVAELGELLSGRSVELSRVELPLERRGLLGPRERAVRIGLTELFADMSAAFADIGTAVSRAAAVWSAVAARLDPVQTELDGLRARAGAVGAAEPGSVLDRELRDVATTLAAVRARAVSDPLGPGRDGGGRGGPASKDAAATGLGPRSGSHAAESEPSNRDLGRSGLPVGPPTENGADLAPDLDAPLAPLLAELRRIGDRVETVARMRDSAPQVLAELHAGVADVTSAEAEADRVRTEVLAKIIDPALPPPVSAGPELRAALERLTILQQVGHPVDAAESAAELRVRNAEAAAEAATALRRASELLLRRRELRGRLDAYQARAGRLGLVEEPELLELHRQAYELLWRAPCDLAAATRAVTRYQRGLAGKEGRR
ncbi:MULTISPECIES: hypothetical protein [Actinoalloteichus]|uniref:Uncharacterized protein n=1 Tax=Actinoalloteichus fjordicus TaxID=1612552 RepID=A0AAC9PRW6_9PSEU|nr:MULTISPECIES: hypothetical protein [Actinoalloteichus]APU14392.1 hypothetical protein UA74_11660 [Actinoalloteichus fjordicus]APU20361.1 hypothetical protein UA75_11745 [Actinoalloteichus sp. GBA129-24]